MPTTRTYGDRCGVARTLDLVGARWALLVVRELLLGPKRFTDLRAGLPNAKPSVLTERLRELEEGDVVRRRRLGPPASTWVYELTELGRELEPLIQALGRVGRSLPVLPGVPYGVDSLVLAVKWRFDPQAAAGVGGVYELRLGDDGFVIEIEDGRFDVRRGSAEAPDVTVDTDPDTLASVLFDGRPLAEAVAGRELRLEGDRALAERFVRHYAGTA